MAACCYLHPEHRWRASWHGSISLVHPGDRQIPPVLSRGLAGLRFYPSAGPGFAANVPGSHGQSASEPGLQHSQRGVHRLAGVLAL